MEARAKYAFSGSQSDELDIDKDDIIKVLDMDDEDWLKAEKNGRIGVVPAAYIELSPHQWYYGKIKRGEAEHILLEKDRTGRHKHDDGVFLVRNSESDSNGFSLSVKHENSVQHFKILSNSSGVYFLWTKQFRSVTELVSNHKKESVSRSPNQILILKEMNSFNNPAALPCATARFDFMASGPDELSFSKGDRLIIKDKSDKDWFQAELNGSIGLIPSNYITLES